MIPSKDQQAALNMWKTWASVSGFMLLFGAVLAVAGIFTGLFTDNYKVAFFLMLWAYVVDSIRRRCDDYVVDKTYERLNGNADT